MRKEKKKKPIDDQDRPAHQQPASNRGRSPAANGQRRPKGTKFSGGPRGWCGGAAQATQAPSSGDSLARMLPILPCWLATLWRSGCQVEAAPTRDEQSRRRPRLGPGPDGRGRGGRGAEAEVAAAEGGCRRLQPRRQFLLPHQHRPSMSVRLRSPSDLAA